MTDYGVTATGFVKKTLPEILDELRDDLKAAYGDDVNTSSASVLGSLLGIMAAHYADLWDLAQEVYSSSYPDSAVGAELDAVCALTGVTRSPATPSTVTLTLNLNAGVTVAAGAVVSVGSTGNRFKTTADATNPGPGAANITVAAASEETGPITGYAGTITTIVTPQSGWNSATNASDATLGEDEETDAALRLRREVELRASGTGTVEALRADLLQVSGVTEALVYENTTMATDGDGVPAKAFEAIVLGGTDQAVANQIWASKPAGIQAYGASSANVTDSQGVVHAIGFTRPTPVNVYVAVSITVDADYPADGDDQVAQAIVDLGDELYGIADDVVYERLRAAVWEVSGVVDITAYTIGTTNPPVGTSNITIGRAQVAAFDTARVTVTS